ncbi:MAG TPA: hypothetical protein VL094_08180 [Sphingomonadaceae bacterium]|nr:hypothetical protein [Sphingomonadaceae bacterium]
MNAVKSLRPILLAAPALLLVSCGGPGKDKDKDERTASGQVLQGSISDAMLPLETVTSEPPLIKEGPKAGPSDAASDAEGEDAAVLDGEQPAVSAASEAAAE